MGLLATIVPESGPIPVTIYIWLPGWCLQMSFNFGLPCVFISKVHVLSKGLQLATGRGLIQ